VRITELDDLPLYSWRREDRQDHVAVALRRFLLRVELCPCQHDPSFQPYCRQCALDVESIREAWTLSETKAYGG